MLIIKKYKQERNRAGTRSADEERREQPLLPGLIITIMIRGRTTYGIKSRIYLFHSSSFHISLLHFCQDWSAPSWFGEEQHLNQGCTPVPFLWLSHFRVSQSFWFCTYWWDMTPYFVIQISSLSQKTWPSFPF